MTQEPVGREAIQSEPVGSEPVGGEAAQGEPVGREAIQSGVDDVDFANEHDDLAVDDGDMGGPEGRPEEESPEGYGGGDYR